MKRPFIQVARFLNEHSSRLSDWLDIAEFKMVIGTKPDFEGFFFDHGKMREREPLPKTREKIDKSVASSLLANGYSERVKTPNQAKSVVRDALLRAIDEVELRMDWWGDEHSAGVPNSSSLALCPLDVNVIEKLRKAGLLSIRQVSLASDESILKIRGIDEKRLGQIRSVCPNHTTAYQRKLEKAKAGQGNLFDVPNSKRKVRTVVAKEEPRSRYDLWQSGLLDD